MLQDFQSIFQFTITISEVIQNLIVALICGLLISFFYKRTYQGPSYLNSFVTSIVILSMITAIVIMVIGNNLARAFGLVGAMSIIRFRTAVKETQDIIYIFFSLAIGMAAGVGLHAVALTGTLFIGVVGYALSRANFMSQQKKEFLLQFVVSSSDEQQNTVYSKIIGRYCRKQRLINVRSLGENGDLELSYYITLRNESKNADFITELKNVEGVSHVNLFFDEESF